MFGRIRHHRSFHETLDATLPSIAPAICPPRTAPKGIACWGSNIFGESNAPTGEFQQVVASSYLSCGLAVDGSVTCWGQDEWGVLATPAEVRFRQLSAWDNAVCGIDLAGHEWCWGRIVRQPVD